MFHPRHRASHSKSLSARAAAQTPMTMRSNKPDQLYHTHIHFVAWFTTPEYRSYIRHRTSSSWTYTVTPAADATTPPLPAQSGLLLRHIVTRSRSQIIPQSREARHRATDRLISYYRSTPIFVPGKLVYLLPSSGNICDVHVQRAPGSRHVTESHTTYFLSKIKPSKWF